MGTDRDDAAEQPSVRLGELTGRQAAAVLSQHPVILLPLGSHEGHGPALPMGDYLAAERIAVLIAQRAQQAGTPCLVAPVLPFGGADFFGSVPGGIALAQSTLTAVLTDVMESLLRHGLDRIVILNGHGGNCQAIHDVTLAARNAHGTVIPSLYLWRVAQAIMAERLGNSARLGHGADPLASIAMHLFGVAAPGPITPEPRRVLDLPVVGFACVEFDGVLIDMPLELDDIAQAGVAPGADPSLATAADGQMVTERLVEIGAALVAHVARLSSA